MHQEGRANAFLDPRSIPCCTWQMSLTSQYSQGLLPQRFISDNAAVRHHPSQKAYILRIQWNKIWEFYY